MCGFFFQAEDGIRDLVRSRGLGDVYKRQASSRSTSTSSNGATAYSVPKPPPGATSASPRRNLSLIHI